MDILKIAQRIEMSIDIPDSKKNIALSLVKKLESIAGKLNSFDSHLDILYNPFSNHDTVSVESVQEIRGTLSRYKEAIKENLFEIKKFAILVVAALETFSSDISVVELLNSFTDFIGELENKSDLLFKDMDNWSSETYRQDILKDIDDIKNQKIQIENLIFDRIIKYINSNILAKSWVSSLNDELEFSINKKEPYIKRLFKERENALQDLIDTK